MRKKSPYAKKKFPYEFTPRRKVNRRVNKVLNKISTARKCLMIDPLPLDGHFGSAMPAYETHWSGNSHEVSMAFPIHSTGKPFSTYLNKNNVLKKKQHKDLIIKAYAKEEISFFKELVKNSNGLNRIIYTNTILEANIAKALSQTFSSIEQHDLTVNYLVINSSVRYKIFPWLTDTVEVKTPLSDFDKALAVGKQKRGFYIEKRDNYTHDNDALWTAEILDSPLCPPDSIFILSRGEYVGVVPIDWEGKCGMHILNDYAVARCDFAERNN